MNFNIFFDHGEEIIYIFQSIWSIWKDWISKFSSTMDVVYSWIFLKITEELTVKIAHPAKKSPGIFWNYDLENLEISWDFIKKYPNNPEIGIYIKFSFFKNFHEDIFVKILQNFLTILNVLFDRLLWVCYS